MVIKSLSSMALSLFKIIENYTNLLFMAVRAVWNSFLPVWSEVNDLYWCSFGKCSTIMRNDGNFWVEMGCFRARERSIRNFLVRSFMILLWDYFSIGVVLSKFILNFFDFTQNKKIRNENLCFNFETDFLESINEVNKTPSN